MRAPFSTFTTRSSQGQIGIMIEPYSYKAARFWQFLVAKTPSLLRNRIALSYLGTTGDYAAYWPICPICQHEWLALTKSFDDENVRCPNCHESLWLFNNVSGWRCWTECREPRLLTKGTNTATSAWKGNV